MPVLNFDGLSASSYDNQDTGPGDLLADGGAVTLDGNLWKKFSLPNGFTVAENSVLRFSLKSDRIGEIIGIGLDGNNSWDDGNPFFVLGGSQTRLPYGNRSYADYTQDQAGGTQDFVIPLAAYAGQSFDYLTLVNDADRISGTDATFSNVELLTPQQTDLPPDADDDSAVTTRGTALTIPAADLLANDSDLNAGDTLTVTDVTGPANPAEGTVTLSGGAVVFTPGDGFVGQTSFTYEVTDASGLTDDATVTVTVQAPNTQAPSTEVQVSADASAISSYGAGQDTAGGTATVTEGGRTVTLSGNAWKKLELETPFEVQANSVLQVSFRSDKVPEIAAIGLDNDGSWNNGNPIFRLGGTQSTPRQMEQVDSYSTADGTVTYVLDLTPWLGESFSFLTFVNDADKGAAAGSNGIFSDIRLGSAGSNGSTGNVAPTADPAGYAIAEDEVLTLSTADLLALADDADGDPLTIDGVSGAVGGSLSVSGETITFTPAGPGEGSFEYTVSDGNGGTASATITVTVDVTGELPPPSGDPVRIQAEDFTSSVVYSVESQSVADGGALISLLPARGTTGSATFDLAANGVTAGSYDITVGYFDENDGTSLVSLVLGGAPIGTITFDDDATSSGTPRPDSFRTETFSGVTVGAADALVLDGTSNDLEPARIDWIEFTPLGGTAPGGTTDTPPAFSGATNLSVAENDVTVGTVSATDPDSTDLTFAIAGTGDDDALFAIDPVSGALRFKAAPDFEAPTDDNGDNVYEVDVSVADATTTVTGSYTVSVGNVAEPGENPVGPPPEAYGAMYFFGDSLTDAAVYGRSTQSLNGQPTANWADLLPVSLGATYEPTAQYNYAVGGAQSGTDNVLNRRPSDTGFLEQVADFAASGTSVADNDIAAVWVGINDIWVSAWGNPFNHVFQPLGTRPGVAELTDYVVGNIVSGVESLIDSGFEKILLLSSFNPEDGDNLPDNATTNNLVTQYATSVSNAMAGLSFDGAQSYFLDMVAFIDDLEANADSFGFDFTDGSQNLADANLNNPTLDEQNAYMFEDEIHLTNGVHQLIAARAAETILTADGFDFVPTDYDDSLNLV